jgi:hypothetical protein
MNWVFISQKTTFFIVTAVKTSNLTSGSSRQDWVDPIPDPMLLRKYGSAANGTQNFWVCSQELWPPLYQHCRCKFKCVTFIYFYAFRLQKRNILSVKCIFVDQKVLSSQSLCSLSWPFWSHSMPRHELSASSSNFGFLGSFCSPFLLQTSDHSRQRYYSS